jgi:hypothetical protein
MRQTWKAAAALVAGLAALVTQGCGYHVAGRGDLLPRGIRSIAIPAFGNSTIRYRLTEHLPAAITQEFVSRTRYRLVLEEEAADAVLRGSVLNYSANPTTFDPNTNRASAVQVSVLLEISLRERATGKVLFSRPRMEFRERYEISVDQKAYLDESDSAMDRLAIDVARTVVSAILENF